jgi:hypothetical protein
MEVSGQLHAPAALSPGKQPLRLLNGSSENFNVMQLWYMYKVKLGPKSGPDAVAKRKIPPLKAKDPGHPINCL